MEPFIMLAIAVILLGMLITLATIAYLAEELIKVGKRIAGRLEMMDAFVKGANGSK